MCDHEVVSSDVHAEVRQPGRKRKAESATEKAESALHGHAEFQVPSGPSTNSLNFFAAATRAGAGVSLGSIACRSVYVGPWAAMLSTLESAHSSSAESQ